MLCVLPWPKSHPSSKLCGKPSSILYVVLLTNKQTNQQTNTHDLFGGGNKEHGELALKLCANVFLVLWNVLIDLFVVLTHGLNDKSWKSLIKAYFILRGLKEETIIWRKVQNHKHRHQLHSEDTHTHTAASSSVSKNKTFDPINHTSTEQTGFLTSYPKQAQCLHRDSVTAACGGEPVWSLTGKSLHQQVAHGCIWNLNLWVLLNV